MFNSEDYELKLKWFEFLSVNLPVAYLKQFKNLTKY